mmetsp:Transcript_22756/g.50293  ORF Transcript_22756/g.50293 Transcript_22756/m.50293 type:complete len:204 (+) Transcript_22756:1010-1621(+)
MFVLLPNLLNNVKNHGLGHGDTFWPATQSEFALLFTSVLCVYASTATVADFPDNQPLFADHATHEVAWKSEDILAPRSAARTAPAAAATRAACPAAAMATATTSAPAPCSSPAILPERPGATPAVKAHGPAGHGWHGQAAPVAALAALAEEILQPFSTHGWEHALAALPHGRVEHAHAHRWREHAAQASATASATASSPAVWA